MYKPSTLDVPFVRPLTWFFYFLGGRGSFHFVPCILPFFLLFLIGKVSPSIYFEVTYFPMYLHMSFVQHSIWDCLLCALHDFTKAHLLSPHTKLCTIACYIRKIMYTYIQREFCLQSYSKFDLTTSHKRALNFTTSIIFGTKVSNHHYKHDYFHLFMLLVI
jgi:hypothetical protein